MVHSQGINHILSYTYGGGRIDFGEIAIKQANKQSRMTRTVKSDLTGDLLSQGDTWGIIREDCITLYDSKSPGDNGYLFNESAEQKMHTRDVEEVVPRRRKENLM